MKKYLKVILMAVALVCTTITTGCNGTNEYSESSDYVYNDTDDYVYNDTEMYVDPMEMFAGTYYGSTGKTQLILDADGTGYYSQRETIIISWFLDGDTIYVDMGGYTIYADTSDGPSRLYFTANTTRWNPELFSMAY